jgi:SAM-dependent methyltransferase
VLFVTSATVLYVELLLIRWIPANVVYVGYFSNFLLMGSFLGIGVGILLGRDGWNPRVPIFALLLFAVVVTVSQAQLNLIFNSTSDVYFGLAETSQNANTNYVVLPLVVALTAAVLACVSLPLGPLLRSMPPLRAYACDVAGSLAGIVLFSALSALDTSPAAWFAVLGVMLAILGLARGISPWSSVTVVCIVAVIAVALHLGDLWSPYQRITVTRTADSVGIAVNGVPHQGFSLNPHATPFPFYTQLSRWFPDRHFSNVLVIGAGAGNDTTVALAQGAEHVDAVEIDPVLLGLGKTMNPAQPYADPRVQTYVNDGRAYLRNTTKQYDLVVFAVTDSLALVSNTADLRLESFLFTVQAFDEVRDHLAPGGVFVLYNYYREPWVVEKLASMLQDSFGYPPIARLFSAGSGAGAVLATGPAIQALHGGPPPGDRVDPVATSSLPPATDDWPFLYLEEPSVASFYLAGLAAVLLLALVSVAAVTRVRRIPLRRFSPHFFVLGAAFLLLETRSLTTFSLLFGTTWLVNAFVFGGILLSVLAAIGVNAVFRFQRTAWLYAALCLSLLVAYVIPAESLLFDPAWLRYAVASAIAFAPVFLANLVFTRSFRDTATADMAFASNLLGAVAGGCLEYVALVTGFRALLLLLLGLYLVAGLLASRLRVLADRDLVRVAAIPERTAASPALSD